MVPRKVQTGRSAKIMLWMANDMVASCAYIMRRAKGVLSNTSAVEYIVDLLRKENTYISQQPWFERFVGYWFPVHYNARIFWSTTYMAGTFPKMHKLMLNRARPRLTFPTYGGATVFTGPATAPRTMPTYKKSKALQSSIDKLIDGKLREITIANRYHLILTYPYIPHN